MWLIIIALAIGLVYASLLYLFSKKYSRSLTILLFLSRTTAVATVAMLLFNPYIKHTTRKIEQPIVVIVQDNSESIVLTKDSVFYKEKYPQLIDMIANTLDKKYEIDYYTFGQNCRFERSGVESGNISLSTGNSKKVATLSPVGRNEGFSEQYTNISNALNTISRQYYKKNVGAVILLSDGIVNQGVNPELNIENYPFPIYSVTLGDTVSYPSMTIKDVRYNKTVPANMLFPLRVTANATNNKGKDMNVIVKMDGNEVETSP